MYVINCAAGSVKHISGLQLNKITFEARRQEISTRVKKFQNFIKAKQILLKNILFSLSYPFL